MMLVTERRFEGPNAIQIPANSYAVVRLQSLGHGSLVRLSVRQTSGTAVAFVVDVLDSSLRLGGPNGTYPNPYPPANVDIMQIINRISAGSGTTARFIEPYGVPFRSMDNPPGGYSTSSQDIYLVIAPTAANFNTTWEASVTLVDENV